MVGYDIICILKDYVGYTHWSDVPIKQRKLCYQKYNNKSILPDWNVQREKFWSLISKVENNMDYGVCM